MRGRPGGVPRPPPSLVPSPRPHPSPLLICAPFRAAPFACLIFAAADARAGRRLACREKGVQRRVRARVQPRRLRARRRAHRCADREWCRAVTRDANDAGGDEAHA
eukprot:6535666-Prymnesium_polylepis.1